MISIGFQWFSLSLIDVSMIFNDFQWFPLMSNDCQLISIGC